MLDWQADRVLPRWVLRYLGATKIHVQRTQFVLGIFNTATIAATAYYTAPISSLTIPGTAIRPFTSILGWLGLVVAGALLFLGVDRALLYPAEVTYNAHQSSREDRNPGYAVTVDSNERIQRIEDELGISQTDGGRDDD